jgi:energy-coupling factor transporter transmembrane protein EcfT
MHPLLKIALLGSLLGLSGLYWDLRYLVVIWVFTLVVVLAAKVPLSWFKILGVIMVAYIPFGVIGVITQANPALFKVYPQSLVSITLGTINLGPLGIYGIAVGGILWAVASAFRLVITMMITYAFIFTTSFNDILGLLGNTRFPRQLLFIIMIAYRFVPEMIRQIQVIMTALRLRGWELRSRSPKIIIERTVPLIKSLLLSSLVTIDEVTLATRIRVFGEHKITTLGYVGASPAQKVASVALLVIFLFMLYLLAVYNMGNI